MNNNSMNEQHLIKKNVFEKVNSMINSVNINTANNGFYILNIR